MATYRQIVYAISDLCKDISDDSTINQDHILFLITKYRNYILNANYSTIKKEIPDSDYQSICLEVSADTNYDICGEESLLKSKVKVPFTMTIGSKSIYPSVGFSYGRINFVNTQKFKYVGNNKYLRNEIYATIGPDQYLYLKSGNTSFAYLSKVVMTAIFEDPEEASLLECNRDGSCVDNCEVLDKRFPLDDSFLPALMQSVISDITGAMWRPKDDENNAADDTSAMANVLSRYTNTAFKNQMNGTNNKQSAQQ